MTELHVIHLTEKSIKNHEQNDPLVFWKAENLVAFSDIETVLI